jgi:hypothetical protein
MKDGEIKFVARQGDRTNSGARIASFADPWTAASRRIILDGYDDSGRSSVCIFDAANPRVKLSSTGKASARSGDMSQPFPGTAAFKQRGVPACAYASLAEAISCSWVRRRLRTR